MAGKKKVGVLGGELGGGVFGGGDTPGDLGIKITADVSQLQGAIQEAGQTLGGFAKQMDGTSVGLGKMLEQSVKVKSGFTSMRESIVKAADGFNEVKQAITGVVDLAKGALELAKFSGELRQMEKAVPLQTLRMMQQAVGGSVDKVTLMKAAMKSLNGEFRLTEGGMQTVLQAADNLADKFGGDTMQTFESLMNAIRTGRTGELKQFGIALEMTGNKQKDLNRLMVEMARIAATPVEVDPQLEAIERLQAATTNWVNDMKAGLGKMVHWAIGAIDQISDRLVGVGGGGVKDSARESAIRAYNMLYGEEAFEKAKVYARNPNYADPEQSLEFRTLEQGFRSEFQGRRDFKRIAALPMQGHDQIAKMIAAARGQFTAGKPTWGGRDSGKDEKTLGDTVGGAFGGSTGLGGIGDAINQWGFMGGLDFSGITLPDSRALGGLKQAGGFFKSDDMEKMREFERQLNDTSTAVGASFSVLSDGIAAGVEAAISGGESIGRAALKASASALKAIAIESAVRALYEGAMGVGRLAIGDLAGAGAHAKSAAMHAAAAAAAGIGAAALGSAAGAGGGGAAAGSYGGGASAGGDGGSGAGFVRYHDGASRQIIPSGNQTPSHVTVNVTLQGVLATDAQQIVELVQKGVAQARTANTGSVRTTRAATYE